MKSSTIYRNLRFAAGVMLVALTGVLFASLDANAAQIKRTQMGTIYFDTDDTSQIVDIQPVDRSKTIILIYSNMAANTNRSSIGLLTADFESSSTIMINRDASAEAVTVTYVVIEFVSGVNVVRGVTAFQPGSRLNPKYVDKTIDLPAPGLTDYTKAFAIIQTRSNLGNNNNYDEMVTMAAWLTSNTTLQLKRDAGNDVARTVNISWQVVEFTEGVKIISGTTTLAVNQATSGAINMDAGHADPDIAAMDKAFLIYSYYPGYQVDGIEGLYRVRGTIASTSTVQFDRGAQSGGANTAITIRWSVVELTDNSSVVKYANATAMATGDTSDTPAPSGGLDTLRFFPNIYISGSTSTTTDTLEDETRLSPSFDKLNMKGIAYDSANGAIWATNYNKNTVTKYNATTGVVIGTYNTGANPIAVCVGASSVWVANYGAQTVTRLLASNGSFIETVTVGATGPIDIAYDPATAPNGTVWTANYNGTTAGNTIVSRITPDMVPAPYASAVASYTGQNVNPTSICYDPGGSYGACMWICYNTEDQITRYRCSDGAVYSPDAGASNLNYSSIRYMPTNGVLGMSNDILCLTSAVSASATGNFVMKIYLPANRTPGDNDFIDAGEFDQVDTDLIPRCSVWNPATNRVWVACERSNVINSINPSQSDVESTFTAAGGPWGLAYDSTNSKVFTSNSSLGILAKYSSAGVLQNLYRATDTVDAFTLSRFNATTTNNIIYNWALAEFSPLTIKQPNGDAGEAALVVSEPATLAWKYADSMLMSGSGASGAHKVKLQISANDSDWFDISGATALDVNNSSSVANEGQFVWDPLPANIGTDIPNLIGTTLKVRIWDTDKEANPASFWDKSNASFKIKGKLIVDTPPIVEPDIWKLGQTKNITWSTKGKLNDSALNPHDMTIYLATDGVTFNHTLWATVDPGTDNSSNNLWSWANIPSSIARDAPEQTTFDNTIGTDNKIKIKYNYVAAGVVESVSNVFTLKGAISNVRVTNPAGNTVTSCLRGGAYKVKWAKLGHFGTGLAEGTVDIKYSQDTGASYPTSLIAGVAAGADGDNGSWDWNIPSDFTLTPATFKSEVRVFDSDDLTVYNDTKTSGNDFDIKSGTLIVSAPGDGTSWNIGTTQNIVWDYTGFLTTVKISLSRDNGADQYGTVLSAAVTASNKSYPWPVVPALSTHAIIKVESTQYPEVSAVSAGNFIIAGAINVTAPADNDTWDIGSGQTIAWSTTGTFTTVNIYVSRDSGGTWGTAIVNGYSAAGTYPWTVAAPGTQEQKVAKVKVESTDFAQQTISGVSALFKIRETIHVTSPNSTGIIWRVGTPHDITWTITGSLPGNMVDIYYKKLVGGTWELLNGFPGAGYQADNGSGGNTYSWNIPNDIHDEVYIKVQDHGRNYINDASDVSFKIKGLVTVTSPSLNEVVKVSDSGESKTVIWSLTGNVTGKADVLLSLTGGAAYPITLTSGDIDINNGSGAGSYTWTVLSTQMGIDDKILVQVTTDPGLVSGTAGESASFKVKSQVKLTYPNELGVTKSIGDVLTITWNAIPDDLGGAGKVDIKYSLSGGANGTYTGTVASNVDANLQTKDWTIPDVVGMVGTDTRIKIYKSDDEADVHSESAFDFAVRGNLVLTRPSAVSGARLTWECGTQESINWNTLGDVGYVKLYFSRDNGVDNYANPIDVTETVPAGNPTGSYLWTIPIDAPPALTTVLKAADNGKNEEVKIKLASAAGSIESISVQPLTIKSRIINLSPNSGTLTVGDSFNITWTTQGDVAAVNVKYSYDGGSTYPGEVALNKTNAGGWLWNPVDSPVDNDIRVRVESATFNNDIKTVSGNDIDAKGKIVITSPTSANRGANALIPTETFRITWVVNGGVGSTGLYSIGLVDLYYAEDGGFTTPFTQVDSSVQSYYDWTVPSPASVPVTTAKIKITDNSDSTVTNTSEAFDIRGTFWDGSSNHALVEPNGSEIYYVGGTDIRIQWRYKGKIGSSELYYDTTGGGGYTNHIATVAYNKNESAGLCYHDWQVPISSGTQYRVKIYAVNDAANCYAASQANFIIKGSVTITSPGKNAGSPELWFVDGDNQIVWTAVGGVNDVDILYDNNSGKG